MDPRLKLFLPVPFHHPIPWFHLTLWGNERLSCGLGMDGALASWVQGSQSWPAPQVLNLSPDTSCLGRARSGREYGKGKAGCKAEVVHDPHPRGTKAGIRVMNSPRHLPGFCHSLSCPPNPHQIPSGGRIQCHLLQAPFEPRGGEEKHGKGREGYVCVCMRVQVCAC